MKHITLSIIAMGCFALALYILNSPVQASQGGLIIVFALGLVGLIAIYCIGEKP